jgi:hypothetical protein
MFDQRGTGENKRKGDRRKVVLERRHKKPRYCFCTDDSGHWYLVPVDRRDEFTFIIEALTDYYNEENFDLPHPTMPDDLDWVERVNPYFMTFTDPQEE